MQRRGAHRGNEESGFIKVAVTEEDKLNTKRALLQGQAGSEDLTSRSEAD